jgi:hypothetical protein
MSAKQIFHLIVILLALWATVTPARAQLIMDEDQAVLPDAFYISKRCKEPQETLEKLKSRRGEFAITGKSTHEEDVAGEMINICDEVRKGNISADHWLTKFESLNLEYSISPNDRSPNVDASTMFITSTKLIPSNFKAYSIFLFPSAEWSKSDREDDLKKIREAFSDFGSSIGTKRAAIWFSKSASSITPDIERSKYYADRFKLNYNDGPFILTSLKRPDKLTTNDEIVVIKLGSISAKRLLSILNLLEQDLRTDAAIRKRALIFEEIKQRLLSAIDHNPEIAKELAKGAISVISK